MILLLVYGSGNCVYCGAVVVLRCGVVIHVVIRYGMVRFDRLGCIVPCFGFLVFDNV